VACEASECIVSGTSYAVTEVAGHTATNLHEFAGTTEFVVESGSQHHRVAGVGDLKDDLVRFYEKDVDHEGRDVRVWKITSGAKGITAEHSAAI